MCFNTIWTPHHENANYVVLGCVLYMVGMTVLEIMSPGMVNMSAHVLDECNTACIHTYTINAQSKHSTGRSEVFGKTSLSCRSLFYGLFVGWGRPRALLVTRLLLRPWIILAVPGVRGLILVFLPCPFAPI